MSNAAYEARRNQQAERELAEERKARERMKREAAADELFDVMLPALRDFFSGNASLVVQDAGNDERRIIFVRNKPE